MTRNAQFQETDFWGQTEISEFARRLYVCLGDSTPTSTSITLDILASRKIHTRGNSDTEILLSLDNQERILRNRNKEKLGSPLFNTSLSKALYGLANPEWGVNAERLLTKSKSESDLRKVGVDSMIWEDLKRPIFKIIILQKK